MGGGFWEYIQLEERFNNSLGSIGVEVAQFDGGSLFKKRVLLQSRRYERRSMIRELRIKVSGDRPALVHDEAVVVLRKR